MLSSRSLAFTANIVQGKHHVYSHVVQHLIHFDPGRLFNPHTLPQKMDDTHQPNTQIPPASVPQHERHQLNPSALMKQDESTSLLTESLIYAEAIVAPVRILDPATKGLYILPAVDRNAWHPSPSPRKKLCRKVSLRHMPYTHPPDQCPQYETISLMRTV